MSQVVLSNDRTKKLDPLVTVNTMAPYSICILLPVWYSTEFEAVQERQAPSIHPEESLLIV